MTQTILGKLYTGIVVSTIFILTTSISTTRAENFGKVGSNERDGKVTKDGDLISYQWEHRLSSGELLPLEFSLRFNRGYDYMQNVYRRKNHSHGNYNRLIHIDPFKEDLGVLANVLENLAQTNNINKVELALTFVQSLPYQHMGDYQRYAVETLIDGKGDCSDTAVLFAGILANWEYRAVFLDFPTHLAVGVEAPSNATGGYCWHWGEDFYFCETTGNDWKVGECPPEYHYASADISRIQFFSSYFDYSWNGDFELQRQREYNKGYTNEEISRMSNKEKMEKGLWSPDYHGRF
jgi:hypothetical protein